MEKPESSIPLCTVLREEYESLHRSKPFPEEYLRLTFYKEHIQSPARFLTKIQKARHSATRKNVLIHLRERLNKQTQESLAEYVANRPDDSDAPHNDPPVTLQDEVVEQLNELLKNPELQSFFSADTKEKASAEYKRKHSLEAFDHRSILGDQLPYFNRTLLESEFPDDIHKVNQTLSGVFAHLHKANNSALCVSGGGIRSASFGLGVMQGLARYGLLGHFDYLSTVSGGGYLGSWLTAWIHRHPDKLDGAIRDLANEVPKSQSKPEPEPIRHLRAFSNYLSPKLGFLSADTWTLAATYIRNLILIWLVLIPFIAAILMVPRICEAVILWSPRIPPTDGLKWLFGLGFFAAAWTIAYMGLKRPSGGAQTVQKRFLWFCLAPLLLSAVLFTTYFALFRGVSASTREYGAASSTLGTPASEAGTPTPDAAATTAGIGAPNSGGSAATTAYKVRSVDEQFTELAKDPGLPLGALFKNTLIPFIIFGVLLHATGGILWAIGWGIESAWRKYTGKKRERDAIVADDKRTLHPLRNAVVEAILIILTGAFGGWLGWLGATKLFPFPIQKPELYVCFAAPLFISLFLAIVILFAGLSSRWTSDEDREWWARMGAWVLIVAATWSVASSLVIFGPMLFTYFPGILASAGGVSGLITLLLGWSPKTDGDKKDKEKPGLKSAIMDKALVFAAPLFAAFVLILISTGTTILVSWLSSKLSMDPGWRPVGVTFEDWHRIVLRGSSVWYLASITGALFVFSLLMARAINTNKFSLHAMYRNRLIRAYLGASNDSRNPNRFTGFDQRDNISMHELWPNDRLDAERNKLLYVVNMALNLTSGDNLAWQERMAESFTVTALHAGNKDLGYRRTQYKTGPDNKRFYGGEKGISLGTAVTISGAAASPNMGYHSSTFVAFLLSLFNVRLGWWLGNPGKPGDSTYFLESPRLALRPIIEETLGLTDDQNPYVYLSDGGHFENLGLYEMVLRRCRFIVVSDATQDDRCSFEDLGNAVRKIRIDLGVAIDLHPPVNIFARSKENPQNQEGTYYACGTIKYSCVDGTPASEDGTLIYIKPAFYGREPRDVYQYAQKNQMFPHESTGDQFFSESQLESYRMLGSYAIDVMLGDWDKKSRERFRETHSFSNVAEHVCKV